MIIQRLRFLALAGCFPAWSVGFALLCFGAALGYAYVGEPAPQLLYWYLVSIPVLAGTGMRDSAREGNFDLLFAKGVSRNELWSTAAAGVVAWHVLIAVTIAFAAGGTFSDKPIVAAFVIAIGNAAIGFAAGSVRPAVGFGLVWLVARFLFIVIPQGAELYAHVIQVHLNSAPAILWKLMTAALFVPEFTLRKNLPLAVTGFFLMFAAMALSASLWCFRRQNLTGHRR